MKINLALKQKQLFHASCTQKTSVNSCAVESLNYVFTFTDEKKASGHNKDAMCGGGGIEHFTIINNVVTLFGRFHSLPFYLLPACNQYLVVCVLLSFWH